MNEVDSSTLSPSTTLASTAEPPGHTCISNRTRERAQEIKRLQESALGALKAGTLWIVLYVRNEPPLANDFHWALYHHRDGQRGGTKYHIRNIGGGWFAEHGPSGNIFKEAFLCALIRVADIPPEKETKLRTLISAEDGEVNLVQGQSCRVWELASLGRLIDKGLIKCEDLKKLEQEVFEIGNEHRFDAAGNKQPRPAVDSSLCQD